MRFLKESTTTRTCTCRGTVPIRLLPFTFGCLLLTVLTGCLHPAGNSDPGRSRTAGYQNRFTVPGQETLHPDLYSLELHRAGAADSPPIIRLGSGEQLILRFDLMENRTRQFRISLTHHNPDWSRSPLPPEEYMRGFTQAFFGGGTPSSSTRPSYRSYEYRFPNDDLVISMSGNYLLRVEDFETGALLFTHPFFVSENQGEITSGSDRFMGSGRDLRDRIIPNSTYRYPDFVTMPAFDLQFWFVQNRFWGRAERADEFDIATPGSVYYELPHSRAFAEDNHFRSLPLSRLDAIGSAIRDFRPDRVPPEVILDIDTEGLGMRLASPAGSRSGRPDPRPQAQYGNIFFRFQPHHPPRPGSRLFLAGDFSNWQIEQDQELRFNPQTQLWETSRFIKEGQYTYRYVIVENNRILDLPTEEFTPVRQELTTFVYFRDPVRHHYRLLQANSFYSE